MSSPPITSLFKRPWFWWLVLSLPLISYQVHSTLVRKAVLLFTVSAEEYAGDFPADITLNGLPYHPGLPCGPGPKRLRLSGSSQWEPFETNCVVPYGPLNLGRLTLARSRGRLALNLFPDVNRVQVQGEGVNLTFTNLSQTTLPLRTGRYTVEVRFPHFREERSFTISRGELAQVSLVTKVTALRLTAEPAEAEFILEARGTPSLRLEGKTPADLYYLPVGEYDLTLNRPDYILRRPLELTQASPTNLVHSIFSYAYLSIDSRPRGAAVLRRGRTLGETPLQLRLIPGDHALEVVKPGYQDTNFSLTLSGSQTQRLSLTLVSQGYLDAMEEAWSYLRRSPVDYDRALAALEKALQFSPADEPASQLQQRVRFVRHLEQAKASEQQKDYARALSEVESALRLRPSDDDAQKLQARLEAAQQTAAEETKRFREAAARSARQAQESAQAEAARAKVQARRDNPAKVFQSQVAEHRYHEDFTTQTLRFSGSVDAVWNALSRALTQKPAWTIARQERLDDDLRSLQVEQKGFISRHKAVLILGQVADNEVMVYYKFFALGLAERRGLTERITDDSFNPITPKYVSSLPAPMVEKKLARETEEFRQRLIEALR